MNRYAQLTVGAVFCAVTVAFDVTGGTSRATIQQAIVLVDDTHTERPTFEQRGRLTREPPAVHSAALGVWLST